MAAAQLAQRAKDFRTRCVIPSCAGSGGTVLDVAPVIGLSGPPPGLGDGQRVAETVVADERAFSDEVGDADPDVTRRVGALVLGLGAGHGQVGAERSTRRHGVRVVGRLVQALQAAAGTAAEAGRTAAWLRLIA